MGTGARSKIVEIADNNNADTAINSDHQHDPQNYEIAMHNKPGDFIVDLSGFEGPLAMLLSLARDKKIDLLRISILDIANQYLQFIDEARQLEIEIAADYLVMAAWLAYLKSLLLLPEAEDDDELSGEELAEELVLRLKKLDAMRKVASQLALQPKLGINRFASNVSASRDKNNNNVVYSNYYSDLLSFYSKVVEKGYRDDIHIPVRQVLTFEAARQTLVRLTVNAKTWMAIDKVVAKENFGSVIPKSVKASVFVVALEMAREGKIQLHQDKLFKPVYIRANG